MNVARGYCRSLGIMAAVLLFAVSFSRAQFQMSGGAGSAYSVPSQSLMQPQQLNDLLLKPSHKPMLIFQVGSHTLFVQAHIPQSEYIGAGSQPAGLAALQTRVSSVPKDHLIVLYCGCCPWDRCPNVAPAYKKLRELGFTNVKILYMPNNFGTDWAAKGYRVQAGQ